MIIVISPIAKTTNYLYQFVLLLRTRSNPITMDQSLRPLLQAWVWAQMAKTCMYHSRTCYQWCRPTILNLMVCLNKTYSRMINWMFHFLAGWDISSLNIADACTRAKVRERGFFYWYRQSFFPFLAVIGIRCEYTGSGTTLSGKDEATSINLLSWFHCCQSGDWLILAILIENYQSNVWEVLMFRPFLYRAKEPTMSSKEPNGKWWSKSEETFKTSNKQRSWTRYVKGIHIILFNLSVLKYKHHLPIVLWPIGDYPVDCQYWAFLWSEGRP